MSYKITLAAVLSIAASAQAALYTGFEPGFDILVTGESRPGEWRALGRAELTSEQKSQGQQSVLIQGAGLLYEFDNGPFTRPYPLGSKLFTVDIRPAAGSVYEQALGQVVISGRIGSSAKQFGMSFFVGSNGRVQANFSTDATTANAMANFEAETWYRYAINMDSDAMKVTHSLSDMSGTVLGSCTFNTLVGDLYSMHLRGANDRVTHFDSLYIGAVPEPSLAFLASGGTLALLARRRRACQASSPGRI